MRRRMRSHVLDYTTEGISRGRFLAKLTGMLDRDYTGHISRKGGGYIGLPYIMGYDLRKDDSDNDGRHKLLEEDYHGIYDILSKHSKGRPPSNPLPYFVTSTSRNNYKNWRHVARNTTHKIGGNPKFPGNRNVMECVHECLPTEVVQKCDKKIVFTMGADGTIKMATQLHLIPKTSTDDMKTDRVGDCTNDRAGDGTNDRVGDGTNDRVGDGTNDRVGARIPAADCDYINLRLYKTTGSPMGIHFSEKGGTFVVKTICGSSPFYSHRHGLSLEAGDEVVKCDVRLHGNRETHNMYTVDGRIDTEETDWFMEVLHDMADANEMKPGVTYRVAVRRL